MAAASGSSNGGGGGSGGNGGGSSSAGGDLARSMSASPKAPPNKTGDKPVAPWSEDWFDERDKRKAEHEKGPSGATDAKKDAPVKRTGPQNGKGKRKQKEMNPLTFL